MSDAVLYPDFTKPNSFWGWVFDGDGGYQWTEYKGKHIIAGDTDSAMLDFGAVFDKTSDVEEVIETADHIGQLVNKSFPDFCMHAFNCPVSRKDRIKTDREVVSDKSLFLSKKRYIMHVVDSEGTRVDKQKITGVEIKKSDTSKAVRSMLHELVNNILDGKNESELLTLIQDMKKRFTEIPVTEIAKPISVKTLRKCQDEYEMTGSSKGFPYQVRAAMFWNSLCGDQDKKIMAGEKVGLLYIKHPKSKYIAFPIDIRKFPAWFDDLLIDYNTEWGKANTKIENYMESIGLHIAGRKATVRNQLFGFDEEES